MNNLYELNSYDNVSAGPSSNKILEVFGDIINTPASSIEVDTLRSLVRETDDVGIMLPIPTGWDSLNTYEIYDSAINAELPYVHYSNVD